MPFATRAASLLALLCASSSSLLQRAAAEDACDLAINLCDYTSPHEFTLVGAPDSRTNSWCQKISNIGDVIFKATVLQKKTFKTKMIGFPYERTNGGSSPGMNTQHYRELRARRRFSVEHFSKLWRRVVSI